MNKFEKLTEIFNKALDAKDKALDACRDTDENKEWKKTVVAWYKAGDALNKAGYAWDKAKVVWDKTGDALKATDEYKAQAQDAGFKADAVPDLESFNEAYDKIINRIK